MDTLQKLVEDLIVELFNVQESVDLTVPDEQFGDLATNIAMKLSPKVGKNPREIAELLQVPITTLPGVESVSIAGPGFINIRVSDDYLLSKIGTELPQPQLGKKVLVEYSDPNPFKPLHAGHLYTTLVGDVLARLVESAGAETIRLNFGGDVGMHVGKTMWAIMTYLGSEDIDAVKALPIDTLGAWMGDRYVEGNNAYDDNEQVQAEIKAVNKRVYQLHAENDHESAFAQIYWYLREQSYEFFKKLYTELEVTPFARFIPESEVADKGLQLVNEHIGTVFKPSDGAIIFDGEAYGLHTRVFVNKEGLPTYEAKDVGLSLTKWEDYHFDESIIITATEQAQYMQVVIKAIEQFAPEPALRTRHLTHGLVKLAGGVKMSSRKGNILSAFDILQAARIAGAESGQADNEQIMLAAVKYALLKNRLGGDIIYDPSESISTEGNSGPYLQYAHTRARSILRKATGNMEYGIGNMELEAGERSLVRKLAEYNDVIARATIELAPHHVCTYLYELAQIFNRFYEQNKVIGDTREPQRIQLVSMYAETLKNGLSLLGIQAPEQM